MTRISVIFPIHENADEIAVTLPAILGQDLPGGMAHEVIAVDDGSGAPVKAALAARDDPRLRVVTLPENRGRAAARNAGVAAARGEWIVFLDSDMTVGRDFLAAHAMVLQGTDISLGSFADSDRLDPPGARPPPPPRRGPGHFTTANAGLRRSVIDAVSDGDAAPFDARTFNRYGWEDLDLDHRLRRLGARRARAARAMGWHHCPPFTPDALPAMIDKEIARAEMARRFLAKHPTWSVRMVTQCTPLHRALWETLSLGGMLNARRLTPLLGWLSARGHGPLASAIARNMILNPTYVRHL